jgi:hypothetical protein
MGLLHNEVVRISIYMDDGNVVGATQEEATEWIWPLQLSS